MSDKVILVEIPTVSVVEISSSGTPGLIELTAPGPQGPKGDTGTSSAPQKFIISASSATWIVYHALGRVPAAVQVFLTSGELIQPDIFIDTQKITVVLANPNTGFIMAI